MHPNGHYGVALIVYAPLFALLLAFNHFFIAAFGVTLVYKTTRIPDSDLTLQRKLSSLSRFIPGMNGSPIKHRGITHTVWFAAIIGFFTAPLFLIPALLERILFLSDASILFGIFIGYVTGVVSMLGHLLADSLTPSGIEPFAPFKKTNYSFNVTKASNEFYNSLFLFLGGLAICAAGVFGLYVSTLPI
jgi:inner membrane protein